MIEVKISGLKVADYWSPTDGWNYDAIDSLAKELYDRYREAEAERTVELFKNYIEEMGILHEIDPFSIDYIRDQIGRMVRPLIPRNMTMREWLRVQNLIYTTALKVYPAYIDKIKKIDALRAALNAEALHRYLIIPFDRSFT